MWNPKKMSYKTSYAQEEPQTLNQYSCQQIEVDTPVQYQSPLRLKKLSVSQHWTTDWLHGQSRSYSEAILRPTVVSSNLRRSIHNSFPSSAQKLKEETNSSRKYKEKSTSPCDLHTLHSNSSSPTILLKKVRKHSLNTITRKMQDTIALGFHAAEGIRVERRIALAKSAQWNTGLIEACERLHSSTTNDSELFGPEFRALLHLEAKTWKDMLEMLATQHKPQSGRNSFYRGRGRTNNMFGDHKRKGWSSWSKGAGGGGSALPTSEKSSQH
ncbi:hypothetical protein BGW37DRAFT_489508 [Umbelopsis sp. PMI_123]|nr:hypothetical protein BGW37DRAFT_489508 [Umbelopsis sp. PMI_123]